MLSSARFLNLLKLFLEWKYGLSTSGLYSVMQIEAGFGAHHGQIILGYTKSLSTKLQGRYVNIVNEYQAYRDVRFVKEALQGLTLINLTVELMHQLVVLLGRLMSTNAFLRRMVGNSIIAMCPQLQRRVLYFN